MRDRGQTETLGFILIFAIITASIGLVYASGFTGLNHVREFETVNNAERAFEVFADNMEDISHRNAPSRSTEVKLANAQLSIADPVQIQVDDPDGTLNTTYDLRPVVYDPQTQRQSKIVYAEGAVMRIQSDGGVVVSEGTLLLDKHRTVIPIIQTRLAGKKSVSGSTTVLIRAVHSQTRLLYVNDSNSNKIWFNVTSPRAKIWRNHLTATYSDVTCEPVTGNTVSCYVTTDHIYVTVVQVDLTLE